MINCKRGFKAFVKLMKCTSIGGFLVAVVPHDLAFVSEKKCKHRKINPKQNKKPAVIMISTFVTDKQLPEKITAGYNV